MRYAVFLCGDTEHGEADAAAAPEPADWSRAAGGAYLQGVRLHSTHDATTVRVRGGELLVTDGPFSDSAAWITGFAILECADLDEAIELAAKHPMARAGSVEVRPIRDMRGPND